MPIEDAIVGSIAGAKVDEEPTRLVEWEGRSYRVSSGGAEAWRLRRVRARQGGLSLVAGAGAHDKQKDDAASARLANTLTSIVYAACLGDPEGPALSAGNIALHHDLGGASAAGHARRVAGADRLAFGEGLEDHRLAARPRRAAGAHVAAANGRDDDAAGAADGVGRTSDHRADRRAPEPIGVDRCRA